MVVHFLQFVMGVVTTEHDLADPITNLLTALHKTREILKVVQLSGLFNELQIPAADRENTTIKGTVLILSQEGISHYIRSAYPGFHKGLDYSFPYMGHIAWVL